MFLVSSTCKLYVADVRLNLHRLKKKKKICPERHSSTSLANSLMLVSSTLWEDSSFWLRTFFSCSISNLFYYGKMSDNWYPVCAKTLPFVTIFTKAIECVCVPLAANTLDTGVAKDRSEIPRISFLHSGWYITTY